MGSFNVHGERIVDGDASTLTVLALYDAGSPNTARTLGAKERLHITDVIILQETTGDAILVADAAAAGKYIVSAGIAAGVPLVIHFNSPYICPAGTIPKYAGTSSNRSMCVIQGFVRES
ncbi:hypothetical protein KAR91_42405 [Candidatus Pacearchaeota archaeon]|nr:hypothetical protein [Candidatus Pacearchaeota archaeon]